MKRMLFNATQAEELRVANGESFDIAVPLFALDSPHQTRLAN